MKEKIDEISQSSFSEIKTRFISGRNSLPVSEEIDFELNVNSENFSELLYYVLLLNEFKKNHINRIRTTLTSTGQESDKDSGRIWAQINTYLSCFSDSLFREREIFKSDSFKYKSLTSPNKLDFGRIIPLIPIQHNTYSFLSQRVEDAFKNSIVTTSNRAHFSCQYSIQSSSQRMTEKSIKVTPVGILSHKEQAHNVIHSACLKYLFNFDSRSHTAAYLELFKKRIDYYTSSDYFDKIKNISVLAFLIFCAYNRYNLLDKLDSIQSKQEYQKLNPKFTKDILTKEDVFPSESVDENLLINAMDMADGLLQLIENIVFHAGSMGKQDGFGVLRLRIYKRGTDSFSNYLETKYRNYLGGHDNRRRKSLLSNIMAGKEYSSSFDEYSIFPCNEQFNITPSLLEEYTKNVLEIESRKKEREIPTYFLEVQLVDNSGKNMCDVFLENHKDDEVEFPFRRTVDYSIEVSSFFDPSPVEQDKWREFNTRADNVIHHYGLQLFDAIIQSMDGCFLVQSISDSDDLILDNFFSSSGDQLLVDGLKYFPGTQYSILLPFLTESTKSFSFINTNIEFPLPESSFVVDDEDDNIAIGIFSKSLQQSSNISYHNDQEKRQEIRKLSTILMGYKSQENAIMCFDARCLSCLNIELFSKSLINFIASNKGNKTNIAIKNCGLDAYKQLVRMFAIFYDRSGNNGLMKLTQIYLCGDQQDSLTKCKNEFLLAGENLHDTLTAQIKLDAARGLTRTSHSGIINFLTNMLKRRPGPGSPSEQISFIPFDLLIKDPTISIFEQNVNSVLCADVQQQNPGCLISPNHMRIGSKIHVDRFYEANVLFGNNYYTGRFAWLIKERIVNSDFAPCTKDRPYLFIGYESYSEILLRDVSRLFPLSEYCVFEYGLQDLKGETSGDRFRRINSLQSGLEYIPIFIVPINSTLTTFGKLEAATKKALAKLNKTRGIAVEVSNDSYFIGVIQTRQGSEDEVVGIEKLFFNSVDVIGKTISSLVLDKKVVNYLFCVQANWSNPIQCAQCFPEEESFREWPIIETDKTSVTPAQLYGLKVDTKDRINDAIDSKSNSESTDDSKVMELYKHVIYKHVYRNSNHFQYYIKADELFDAANQPLEIDQPSKMETWLRTVKKSIAFNESIHFDIIVCPENFSNSGFVKFVNEVVFGGASLVITLSVEKEYRDNFIAKHSDISNIIENLKRQQISGEINFHYVDDAITTGVTFNRVKSLVSSLCSSSSNGIKINIFKSIIVLVNRNSFESRRNYSMSSQNFYSYIDLHISSLRTHNNACVLCQETAEYKRLVKRSALNYTRDYFYSKYRDIKPVEVIAYDNSINGSYAKESIDSFLLMVCTHDLNTILASQHNKNYRVAALLLMLKSIQIKLIKNITLKLDAPLADGVYQVKVFVALITAISTPFISFRKSFREASFKLIIFFMDMIINQELRSLEYYERMVSVFLGECIVFKNTIDEKSSLDELDETALLNELFTELSELLKEICEHLLVLAEDNANKYCILKALVEQSVSLKSNYIIRRENLKNIINMLIHDSRNLSDEEIVNDSFLDFLQLQIKRLVASGSDQAKSVFLEYLLLYGQEFPQVGNAPTQIEPCFDDLNLINHLLIENSGGEQDFSIQRQTTQMKLQNRVISKLIWGLYLENTQIIYDAVHTLALEESLSSTSGKYYLENFNLFKVWNKSFFESIDNGDTGRLPVVIEKLIDLERLLTDRSPNVPDNNHTDYYDCVRALMSQILETKEIFVYMFEGNDIHQILPETQSLSNKLAEHAKKTYRGEVPSIGETFYFDNVYRAIQLTQNQTNGRLSNHSKYSWYFIYENNQDDHNILKELCRVRLVLSLRDSLLNRFQLDFANNHSSDYLKLKGKILKLSTEKAGSHTPFQELADSFQYIDDALNPTKRKIELSEILLKSFSEQLKFISDSVISKLFVLSIFHNLPEQIDKAVSQREKYLISKYIPIMLLAEHLYVNISKGIIRPSIHGIKEIDEGVKIQVPDKSAYIWCSTFIALILNALRHGYENNLVVDIYVEINKDKDGRDRMQLCNKKSLQNENEVFNQTKSMTLSSIKYFFHSYGFTSFAWNDDDPNFFYVWLPLEA